MKKLCTLLALAVSSIAFAAAPPFDRVLDMHFNQPKTVLAYWPREYAKNVAFPQTGGVNNSGALEITPGSKNGSFYLSYPGWMYSGFRSTVPGVLTMSFDSKLVSGTASPISIYCALNKHKGRNGSNGSVRFDAPPPGSEFSRFTKQIFIPADTYTTQISFSFQAGSGKLLMDNLKFSYFPDKVVLPYSKYNCNIQRDLTDNSWNPQYELGGFYRLNEPSKLDTRVRVGADSKGLFIAFINPDSPAQLKANIKKNDDPALWHDDVNSVFIFNPDKGLGWQFMVNSNGIHNDYKMYQKVHGDPWRSDVTGNCKNWKSYVKKDADTWQTRFFIPWSAVGITYKESAKLKLNLTREAKGIVEDSSFNCGSFRFNDLNGWADLYVDAENITIQRSRELNNISYTVDRKCDINSIIEKAPKGAIRSNLWSMHYQPSSLPESLRKKYSAAEIDAYLVRIVESTMAAGSAGPQYPWSQYRMPGKLPKLEELQAKYGKGMLFSMFSSDTARQARKLNAVYTNSSIFGVDPVDPAFVQAGINYINNFVKNKDIARIKKNIAIIRGRDEPTNQITMNFSPASNKNSAALAALDEKIKAGYGFGKYGLPLFAATPDKKEQLSRIAFYRWWNDEHRKAIEKWTALIRKEFPDAIWHVSNANTVSGKSMLDMALLDDLGDEVSCDPYPTSTKSLFGMERALYHVGYSTKLIHNAAPNTRTQSILQAFIYHGGKPSVNDMREWASQAMKNGARTIEWYIDKTCFSGMFEGYVAMLNIMRQLNDFPGFVPQNKKPASGIWFSNLDQWAFNDRATHTAYTVYSLLGEHLKSDFRFVFDTHIRLNKARLNELKVLYIPRMHFTDDASAKALAKFVKDGGRLVIFDPGFMAEKIDGTVPAERNELTGVDWPLQRRRVTGNQIRYQNVNLPLTEVKHFPGPADMPLEAYDITVPADARVIASYPDGKPAAFERKLGKGSVVFFAAQPFGNSNLAVKPGNWMKFFADEAKLAGIPTGLKYWDFLLPPAGNSIKLEQLK